MIPNFLTKYAKIVTFISLHKLYHKLESVCLVVVSKRYYININNNKYNGASFNNLPHILILQREHLYLIKL